MHVRSTAASPLSETMTQNLAEPRGFSRSAMILNVASLLASRLCHDIVNPVGAISTGLDLLATEDDPEMQEQALRLVRESTAKSLAIVSLARIAYGSSGAYDGEIDVAEAGRVATDYFAFLKPTFNWRVAPGAESKLRVRALLNMLLAAERSAPRDSNIVTVSARKDAYVIDVEGPRVRLADNLRAALSGVGEGLEPKDMPAYLAYLLSVEAGDVIEIATAGEEHLCLTLARVR